MANEEQRSSILLPLVLLGALAVGVWYFLIRKPTPAVAAAPAQPLAPQTPVVVGPVYETTPAVPMPARGTPGSVAGATVAASPAVPLGHAGKA